MGEVFLTTHKQRWITKLPDDPKIIHPTKVKIVHLRAANSLIARAKADKDAVINDSTVTGGTHCLACIHDASAASSTKKYAETTLRRVCSLCSWTTTSTSRSERHIIASDELARLHVSGRAQLLHTHSNKAKRVSYSTGNGETVAVMNSLECSMLVSTRLAEITFGKEQPPSSQSMP